MNLEKLIAMAEGKDVIKKAFQDVRYEIMVRTLINLAGNNLDKELDKSIDEFMAIQDKTDETSQGVSKIITEHVKKDILWSVANKNENAEPNSYEIPC